MTHIGSPHLLGFLGVIAGALAVSFAIYFQMVSPRIVPRKYIAAFFFSGSLLLMVHAYAIPPLPDTGAFVVRAVGIGVVFMLEIVGFWWVIRHTEAQRPSTPLDELIDDSTQGP